MQACDPRELLLFLPRLAELLSRAASYVHTCTVHAAITYLPASPEDPQATPAAAESQPGGDAGGTAAAGKRVSMDEVTQGKRVFDEVAEHLLALAVRALGRLQRRNAAHVGDVLEFAGRVTMTYVRPPSLRCRDLCIYPVRAVAWPSWYQACNVRSGSASRGV